VQNSATYIDAILAWKHHFGSGRNGVLRIGGERATGDPNGKGLAAWPAVDERPEFMEVGDKTGAIPVAGSHAKFKFLIVTCIASSAAIL
jgi:hypothetical protein